MKTLENKNIEESSGCKTESNYKTLDHVDLTDIGLAIGGGKSNRVTKEIVREKSQTKKEKTPLRFWIW